MTESTTTAGQIPPILLVGCGRMGSAMLAGWREQGLAPSFAVDPSPAAASFAGPDLTVIAKAADLPAGFAPAAVVVAVKPQNATETLPDYARFAGGPVFLSIMAGRTIAGIAKPLGAKAAIVRAMPNTPAAIRQGVTVACPAEGVSIPQRSLCDRLLHAIGSVAWVEDEAFMDPVTAVSGSGPAYVFLLIECLAEAGIAAGLPAELAMTLARSTVSGSGELARLSSEDAAQLRRNVTSPGGTTEAALKILMAEDGMAPLMRRAIAAATARSRELAD